MIGSELLTRVQRLIQERRPFVLATVVQARRPTSVGAGDAAIVLADGTIDGFVGGACAVSSVRLHSLRALETGDPLVLRLVPAGEQDEGDGGQTGEPDQAGNRSQGVDGILVERNPCLSGGTLEIFLQPHLPAARLVIVGDSPTARSLEGVGAAAGYDCHRSDTGAGESLAGAAAVVVASHGNDEEAVLTAALQAGVPYVALVASERRGTAVRAELDVPDQLRAELHTPAGLRIGARTPQEIAISILAELVAHHHSPPKVSLAGSPAGGATDPVCGMRVAVTGATPRLRTGSELVFFCSDGCRARYAREHAGAVAAS